MRWLLPLGLLGCTSSTVLNYIPTESRSATEMVFIVDQVQTNIPIRKRKHPFSPSLHFFYYDKVIFGHSTEGKKFELRISTEYRDLDLNPKPKDSITLTLDVASGIVIRAR